jgi:hypothetical protein
MHDTAVLQQTILMRAVQVCDAGIQAAGPTSDAVKTQQVSE